MTDNKTVAVRAAAETDLPAVLAIYNDAVLKTTAIWNDAIVDLDNRLQWFEGRRRQSYPVLVATQGNAVIGYASFGDFRAFDGYRFTVENSVYVAENARRQGAASALLNALIVEARTLGKHVMVAGIAGENEVSIRLHAKFGFIESARMPEIGTKFGRWLDLVFMQLRL
jgi:L-amino acid N-acyltransferase